jgi:hypothetical protein
LWNGFRADLKGTGLRKAERAKILGLLISDLELNTVVDVLDLASRLERLERQGFTLEELKELKVEKLEQLLGYIEDDTEGPAQ